MPGPFMVGGQRRTGEIGWPGTGWIKLWPGTTSIMRIGSLLLVIWLAIGLFAAYQRDDFNGKVDNCNKAATIAVTIVVGPLNYVGVNPKINCTGVQVPKPSK